MRNNKIKGHVSVSEGRDINRSRAFLEFYINIV